ncbi:Hsp20/alpha crystallin family protein [Desulforamulus aquiferis]|uniref:Hsp20/alpha crystallin family protein n=1 Tax=Desulforamulus aquiferis TaxID=1397668 RepID=A0AAW7ZD69_9FIRM|nr:Hsp20/alpha crystallin family protein [Desulforamulus aquiferis]MDO7787684.1 Hsp20/alpha crystallin family protein [Desulforamulus aquiferis]RYD05935.1 hypothetical protein N752_06735 [Desulforamulus aquiferis]
MSLTPYNTYHHMQNMRREMDRFFTTSFSPMLSTDLGHDFGIPRIDLYQTDSEVIASCDIPGLEKKEDVHIEIDNNLLNISGNINRFNEINENQMYRQERFVGKFQRSITLPPGTSPEGIQAVYKNGVLDIRIPKTKGTDRKRINVEFQ